MKPSTYIRLSSQALTLALCACLPFFCGLADGQVSVKATQSNAKSFNFRDAFERASPRPSKENRAKAKGGKQGMEFDVFSIPLETTPYWSSDAIPFPASVWGTHLLDLTNDGYPEVVTVGEQMPCYVFANRGGVVDAAPSWQSNDADPSIWASFGDYDHDGYPDMAVANYSLMGGQVKVYHNENGALNPDAVWTGSGGGVSCEWGDVNNDGYPDLAAVDLFRYPSVYMNRGGTLETIASWQATDYNMDMGCAWVDVDNDGWLDLVATDVNWEEPTLRVYRNNHGTLETAASWTSKVGANNNPGGIPSAGDLDKDGWQDVAVPTWPLGRGSGPNVVFKNQHGVLDSMPTWYSNGSNSSNAGALGDLNEDGYLDWAVNNLDFNGIMYENSGGTLNRTPAWQSSTTGGIGIELGDVDQDGVRYREDTLLADGTKRFFYLSVLPVHRLEEILLNGNPLPMDAYCYSLKSGWVSLRDSVSAGSRIIVRYRHSVDMELLQSDYDNSRVHLFRNTNGSGAEEEERVAPERNRGYKAAPNPFVSFATLPGHEAERFALYDISGRMVGIYRGDRVGMDISAGIYFLRPETGEGRPLRVVKLR